jgi:hypothetical protein
MPEFDKARHKADKLREKLKEIIMFETAILGDMNCDRWVDIHDVAPFIQALLDPAGYAAAYPNCDASLADLNGDGLVNGNDIQGLASLLLLQ